MQQQKLFARDSEFYGSLLKLSIPIVVSQLLNSLINMLDTLMVGRLGETSIAAVALANQVSFIYFILLFGISSGASIFMAQFWGKSDLPGIHRSTGLALALGLVACILFTTVSLAFPSQALYIFSKDPEVVALGVPYLRSVAVTYLLVAISQCFMAALRSTGQTHIPMFMTILALFTNLFFNSVLIFGLFGVPAMGVLGAGIATSIARFVECAVLLLIVFGRRLSVAAGPRQLFDLTPHFIAQYFKTSTFVIFNELEWAIGNSLYNVAYRASGTVAQAAVQIGNTVQNLAMVLAFSIGNACAILLGNKIGEGREDLAFLYAKRCLVLTAATGVLMAVLLPLFSPAINGLFNVSPEVHVIATQILWIIALLSPIRCTEFTLIVGILRSGGDTRFSLFADMFAVYAISLPLTFLAAYVWHLPVWATVLLANSEMLVKCIIVTPRVISKKWINDVVSTPQIKEPSVEVA